uniref:hypothetical protein n=1 Tax=Beijerinckia sp. L45 TaxID=1641855 RepID=UPI00131BC97B
GTVIALPLEGIIDFAAERARLVKEIAKHKSEAEKIEAKLGNEDFLKRAPDDIVEEQRERLAAARSQVARLEIALSRLGPV